MTNEVTQDAEESATIEKTAENQTESITATAEAAAPQPETAVERPATETEAAPEAEASEAPVSEAAAPAETALAPFPASEPAPAPAVQAAAPVEAPQAEDSSAPAEIDFGAILEQFEQEQTVFHAGEMVTGSVVGITDRGVLVDFGYKSEGFVPVEEFTGPNGEMTATVGETVEVVIRTIYSGDGAPQLSRIDALGRKVWDDIEAAFQAETPVIGRVLDKTKGGLRIDLNGIEAFLPGSQIDSRPIRGLDTYIGQDIEAKIIKFSRRRNNIVLSRKVITDEVVNVQKAETLTKIDVGHIVDGTIKNLTEYGAFVDIGGIDGLLHVTDMSWGRIHHPGDQFKVGDHIQVKVLKLDREREKVSLGFKQLLPDPWSTVVEVYPVNTKLKGIVSSVTEYGVFVELEAGVEGLVHVSEISWSRRSQSPKRLFHKGQEVEVQVLGVDTVEKRISLGMRQFQENPWDTVDIKYPVGAKIIGRVRNLTDFGAFIELEEGIDGLVHVSDISWAKKIKHPKDVLKKDQEVEAIVTSIDKRGQRLSLSMKDLTPSAWEGFVATHRPGDVVKGKVSRFTNFGVFVELGEGLEGLCHISELSDERVDRAESVAELGQEMDFKILRIEPADQKIGLSHRAVGKADEPVVDTKMYSTEAKGGMASLGELANLRFGGEEEEAPVQEDPEEKKRAKKAAKQAKAEEFAAKEAEAAAKAEAGEIEEAPAEETSADSETVTAEAKEETAQPEATDESAPVKEETTPEVAAESSDESTQADTPAEEETAPEAAAESSEEAVQAEAQAEEETSPDIAAESSDEPEADAPVAETDPSDENAVEPIAETEVEPAEDAAGANESVTEPEVAGAEPAIEDASPEVTAGDAEQAPAAETAEEAEPLAAESSEEPAAEVAAEETPTAETEGESVATEESETKSA
ncbi:MAG: S1 RNA-binding domain-containing protein [Pyrinomonadaceae bacterium]